MQTQEKMTIPPERYPPQGHGLQQHPVHGPKGTDTRTQNKCVQLYTVHGRQDLQVHKGCDEHWIVDTSGLGHGAPRLHIYTDNLTSAKNSAHN